MKFIILAILILIIGCEGQINPIEVISKEMYSVVKADECYSYRVGDNWVSRSCYKSEKEARDKMNNFIEFRKMLEEHKNGNWIDIEG